MSQFLSTHGFRWLMQAEINDIIIKYSSDDSENGYIFEVDLTNPESLHPRQSDYPLAPERLTNLMNPCCHNYNRNFQHIKTKLPPN